VILAHFYYRQSKWSARVRALPARAGVAPSRCTLVTPPVEGVYFADLPACPASILGSRSVPRSEYKSRRFSLRALPPQEGGRYARSLPLMKRSVLGTMLWGWLRFRSLVTRNERNGSFGSDTNAGFIFGYAEARPFTIFASVLLPSVSFGSLWEPRVMRTYMRKAPNFEIVSLTVELDRNRM